MSFLGRRMEVPVLIALECDSGLLALLKGYFTNDVSVFLETKLVLNCSWFSITFFALVLSLDFVFVIVSAQPDSLWALILSPSPPIYRQSAMVSGVRGTICHIHYFAPFSDM